MRNARTLTLIALLLVPTSAGAYTLVSREHGFSIELPGEPSYHGERAIFIRDKEYDGLGWDYEEWSVEYMKLAPALGGARVVSDIINERGRCRVIVSQKAVRQSGVSGREAVIRDTQYTRRHGCGFKRFTKRVRGFVVRNRFYWIEYKTYAADEMDPEVTRVIEFVPRAELGFRMPELPEVETVRRGLQPVMEGARFVRVEARRPDLRFPFPKNFANRLEGPDRQRHRPAREVPAGGYLVRRGAADASRHVGLVPRAARQRRRDAGRLPLRARQAFGARPRGVPHVERRGGDVQRSAPLRLHEADPAHRAQPASDDRGARARAARQRLRRRDAGGGLRRARRPA